jgi:hypothetical protein
MKELVAKMRLIKTDTLARQWPDDRKSAETRRAVKKTPSAWTPLRVSLSL